jgi:hypothetical protein
MAEKHILFAINRNPDKKIETQILTKYHQVTNKGFTFDSEYYLEGVEKALQEKPYDVLVLREDLVPNKLVSVKFLDSISDKHPELNIIFVVDDEHQSDKYIIDIYSLGIYNILYREDLTLGNVVGLIEISRKKFEAKIYLELEDTEEATEVQATEEDVLEIPEDELITIMNSLRNSTSENISSIFDEINRQYERRKMLFLVSLLSEDMERLLSDSENENYLKLSKNWEAKVQRVEREEKARESIGKREKFKEKAQKPEKIIIEKERIVEVEKKVVEKIYIEKEKEVKIYETPSDYKKKAGFVGHKAAGSTTIINLIADYLSSKKVKVAIVDMTESRDLYDIYPFHAWEDNKDESKEKTEVDGSQSLNLLVGGTIKPYKISKHIDLFTAPYEKVIEDGNPYYYLQLLEHDYDVILIDMDYKTPISVYQALNSVYMLQTLDLPKLKHNTGHELRLKEEINMKKIKYVVNQAIPCGMKAKDMLNCLKYYTNLDNSQQTQLIDGEVKGYIIGYSNELRKMSYEMEYSFSKLEKETMDSIKDIIQDIYPMSVDPGETEGLFNKIGRKLFGNKSKEKVIKKELISDNEPKSIKENKKNSAEKEEVKEVEITKETAVITEEIRSTMPNEIKEVELEDLELGE